MTCSSPSIDRTRSRCRTPSTGSAATATHRAWTTRWACPGPAACGDMRPSGGVPVAVSLGRGHWRIRPAVPSLGETEPRRREGQHLRKRLGELLAADLLAVDLQPLRKRLVEEPPLGACSAVGGPNVFGQPERDVQRLQEKVSPLPASALSRLARGGICDVSLGPVR